MPFPVIRRLYSTFRVLIHEIAKFGIVGAIAYAITVGVSNWLHFGAPRLGPLTSLAIAMLIAATFSYFANRHWTWRTKARTGLRREYSLFVILTVIGAGITEVPVGFSEYVLGLHSALAYNISAQVIGTGLATIFRFWSYKKWVFVDASEPEEERIEEAAETVARTFV